MGMWGFNNRDADVSLEEGYILLQFDSVTELIFPESLNILDQALVQSYTHIIDSLSERYSRVSHNMYIFFAYCLKKDSYFYNYFLKQGHNSFYFIPFCPEPVQSLKDSAAHH